MDAAPPHRTYPAGVTCWVDTTQPDVDAACAFYGGLFGWTFTDAMPPEAPTRYVVAQLDGRDVAAVGGPGPGSTAWNTYVAVDDVDAVVPRLTALGARVLEQPADAGPGAGPRPSPTRRGCRCASGRLGDGSEPSW